MLINLANFNAGLWRYYRGTNTCIVKFIRIW